MLKEAEGTIDHTGLKPSDHGLRETDDARGSRWEGFLPRDGEEPPGSGSNAAANDSTASAEDVLVEGLHGNAVVSHKHPLYREFSDDILTPPLDLEGPEGAPYVRFEPTDEAPEFALLRAVAARLKQDKWDHFFMLSDEATTIFEKFALEWFYVTIEGVPKDPKIYVLWQVDIELVLARA